MDILKRGSVLKAIVVLGIFSIFTFIFFNLRTIKAELLEVGQHQLVYSTAKDIVWLDEVLTHSTRSYAYTANEMWKARYDKYGSMLDESLLIAQKSEGNAQMKQLFVDQSVVNSKLVDLELKIFRLVKNGEQSKALSIIDSKEYVDLKSQYTNLINIYLGFAKEQFKESRRRSNKFIDFLIKEVLVLSIVFFVLYYLISTKVLNGIKVMVENLRESEKAAKKGEEAKLNFLANMSHEIRTPLNGIIGMASVFESSKLNEEQAEKIEIIKASGEGLLATLNDILDFSKIESGKLNIATRTFSLNKVIEDIVGLYSVMAKEKGIEIKLNIDKKIPDYLESDDFRLRQILNNILDNAIKFSDRETSVLFDVSLIQEESELVEISFKIKDNGIGMSREDIKKVFNAFSQADESITRRFGGTGLGLAISRDIAVAMGGALEVESEVGIGSTFTLNLKFKKGSQLSQEDENEIDYDSFSTKYPHKVLVVEDNQINQKLIVMMLKKLGYTFDLANNGKEAVEKCDIHDYSLVLMDMQMPVMDGITATEIILQKQNKAPVVVALTANAFEDDKKKCFAAGMKHFLSKPLKIEQLAHVITQIQTNNKSS